MRHHGNPVADCYAARLTGVNDDACGLVPEYIQRRSALSLLELSTHGDHTDLNDDEVALGPRCGLLEHFHPAG